MDELPSRGSSIYVEIAIDASDTTFEHSNKRKIKQHNDASETRQLQVGSRLIRGIDSGG